MSSTAFIHLFGSRGANEWDVIAPTWEVSPETALSAIDLMRRSDESNAPVGRRSASVAERDRLIGEVRAKLAGNEEARATFEAGLQSAQVFLSGRERYKTNCIIVVGEIRMCLRELARRMVERGVVDCVEQFFMVTNSELDAIRQRPGDFRDVLAERWTEYQILRTLEPPFVVNGIAPTRSDLTARSAVVAQAASGRCSQEPPAREAPLAAAPGSCTTPATWATSSPATCSSRRRRTPPGSRCSSRHPRWW